MKSTVKKSQATGDRRREIAAAARSLIAERGFEGLRTRDIADRVGINIATLHYHVPSKEALIALVGESMRDDFIAQNITRPRTGMTSRELLLAEFADFRDNATDNPELLRVFAEFQERARRDPVIHAVVKPMQSFWFGHMRDIIQAGRADGSFRADIDPEAAALMVLGGMIASQRHPNASPEFFDRLCAELLRALDRAPDRDL